MVDPKLLNSWIEKADEDLEYARISLAEGLEFYPQICFLLHQAVEKYLKAYIIASELDFQKIHDLGRLVKICGQKDDEFNQYFDMVAELNSFYIETRYPDFEVTVSKAQAEDALQIAKQVADFVKQRIGSVMYSLTDSADSPQVGSPPKEEPAPSETDGMLKVK